jgi:hypothetical protein
VTAQGTKIARRELHEFSAATIQQIVSLPSGRAPSGCPRRGSPSPHPGSDFVADDWEDMTVADKLDHLLSRLDTLERRLEEILIHLSDLSNAVEAIELKLQQ